MKRNSKKLAVLVVIAAIGMFATVAMAWDAPKGKNTIKGEYAMMAAGTCLVSPGGFNSNDTPIGPSSPASSMATGIWTFHGNGTGTVKGTAFQMNLPPNPTPSASSQSFSFNFTYKVTDDDTITADMVGLYNATYLTGPMIGVTVTTDTFHFFGNVSADAKTITLASGNAVQEYTGTKPDGTLAFQVYNICNLARVLIRLDE